MTAEPISDIYYKRNIDPDNEQIWSGSYVTINSSIIALWG